MQREARRLRGELLSARLAATTIALGVLSGTGAARAHGAAPSAIDVLATDDRGTPTFVALSQGLAKRESTGAYSFVCPAAWGSQDAVLAGRGDLLGAVAGGRLFVRGGDACALAPVVRDEAMIDVVAAGEGLLALGRSAATTRVLAVSTAGVVVRAEASLEGPSACVLDAVVTGDDGRIVGSCAAPRPALFLPETEPNVRPFVLPFAVSRLVPRAVTDETISLLAIASKGSFLVDLDRGDPAAPPHVTGPFATVLGPVRVGGARVAVVDGHLWERRAGTWTMGAAVPYTCLSQVGASAFACSLGATVRLERREDTIVEAEPVFSLAMLGAPTAACGAASGDAATCRGEWSHFGAEAGLLDTLPATVPGGPRLAQEALPAQTPAKAAAEDGCAVTGADRSLSSWTGPIIAAVLWRLSRSRRRPSFSRRAPGA